jgi:hypothetical protein
VAALVGLLDASSEFGPGGATMDVNAPISLVVARYDDPDEATRDFKVVWSARADGAFHHTSVAVLARDPHDDLAVDLSDSTAKYLVWGGALMSAGLFVLAPTVGVRMLTANGLSGAGAIISHLRMNADQGALTACADLLERSRVALVVVAVNRRGDDTVALLERASETSSVDLLWGDLEEELSPGLRAAQVGGSPVRPVRRPCTLQPERRSGATGRHTVSRPHAVRGRDTP